ncbi:MAG: D-2-hydroxyacid dehydrogenase [Bacteroidales bacterium]|nr:D-2-hydroxyacid dehydrogenase [Bacteroidales bacterium]
MKIVVVDGYTLNPGDLSWEPLKELGEVTIYDRTAPDETVARCIDADMVLTNKVIFNAEVINALPKLKYIGVLATGYNVVDTMAATEHNVIVTNIPAYSTESVAQMVFAQILNITNRVGHYACENSKGRWTNNTDFCYWDTQLTELAGKKIGIVGLGNTGSATARIANAFGMDVCAFTSKPQESIPNYITKLILDELFSQCDIVSLHCPLTETTKELVNEARLATMKPTAILINTGRGPLINEQAVADALNCGKIAAFGADVLSVEPAQPGNPLLGAKNCYLTPHIAWATYEARIRLMNICIDNVKAFINGTPQNVVN